MRGIDFIEYTRYGKELAPTDEMKGILQPEIEEPSVGDLTYLPEPDRESVKEQDLSEVIEMRESIRDYAPEPLAIQELSYLLWCTAGIKWPFPGGAFRTVPSAGCCHAIDTYLAIFRVEGIKPGLYRYVAMEHALEMIPTGPDLLENLSASCFQQPCVNNAAVVFLWIAESYRMIWKYGERGYRNLFLDAGHICQNLYLAVNPVNCGCCAIGAFRDQEINEMLHLDGIDRFILYLATTGKYQAPEESTEDADR